MNSTADLGTEVYFLPEPDKEVQRLTDQDAAIAHAMEYKRILAPLEFSRPGLKVLDSATADGLFLRYLETVLTPPFTLVGADVMPSFFPPREAWPSHTTYKVHDIAQPWPTDLHESFDFVHQRLVLAGCGKSVTPRTAVQNLAACVAPGGWLQLGEMDARGPVIGGTAMQDSWTIMRAVFDSMGTGGHDFAHSMASWLAVDGFKDVVQMSVDVDIGPRCEDSKMGDRGANVLLQSSMAVLAASQMLKLDVPPSITEGLPERLAKEVKTEGVTYRMIFVYGRKGMAM